MAEGEIAGALAIEEDDGLGRQRAVLGRAEGERIDAGPPGEVRRAQAAAGDRVGEARAIHVDGKPVAAGDAGERRQFVRRVDLAHLGPIA